MGTTLCTSPFVEEATNNLPFWRKDFAWGATEPPPIKATNILEQNSPVQSNEAKQNFSTTDCCQSLAISRNYQRKDDKCTPSPCENSSCNCKAKIIEEQSGVFREISIYKEESQDMVSNTEFRKHPRESFFLPGETRFHPEDTSVIKDAQPWGFEITGRGKEYDLNSFDCPPTVDDSNHSNEPVYFEKRKRPSKILELVDLPIIEVESGYCSSCNNNSSTHTVTPEMDLDEVTGCLDYSSTGGVSASPKNLPRNAGCKGVCMWVKNLGVDSCWGKYAEIFENNKIDGPTLNSLTLDELESMGVVECHAKEILARVHPSAKHVDNAIHNQLHQELLKLADSDKHSWEEKFILAVEIKQHALSRTSYEMQKRQVTELEAAVSHYQNENESVIKQCGDLDLRNKDLHKTLAQTIEKCEAQTKRAKRLQEDLDQSVAEVGRLEGLVWELRVEKNKFWNDLQVKKQSCEEQREMIIKLKKKYYDEVQKLRRLITSKHLDMDLHATDSAFISSVAFDDLPSERLEFFADHQEMQDKQEETKTDEQWRSSHDSFDIVLQNVTNSFGAGAEIPYADEEQSMYIQSANCKQISLSADKKLRRQDTSQLEQFWDDCRGDVSFLGSNNAHDSLFSQRQSNIPLLRKADFPQTIEQIESCTSSAPATKEGQVSFPLLSKFLSPGTLSSLMVNESSFFNQSLCLTDEITRDELFQKKSRGSYSVDVPEHSLPDIVEFENEDFHTLSEYPNNYDEELISSTKIGDDTGSCSSTRDVVSSIKLVESVIECLQNVVSADGLLCYETFTVTLTKDFCFSNDLLRSVFDNCITYEEQKISLNEFKEKVMWDISEPFGQFRNAIFRHNLPPSNALRGNEASESLEMENLYVNGRSSAQPAKDMLTDSSYKSILAEENCINKGDSKDLLLQPKCVRPQVLSDDVSEEQ